MTASVIGAHAVAERTAWFRLTTSVCSDVHSFAYALLNATFLVRIALTLWAHPLHSWCAAAQAPHESLLWVYFSSKAVEGLDLVWCSLRGAPIGLHFRLHHYTTATFAYLFWRGGTAVPHALGFMTLNVVMHCMLYAFLALPSTKPFLHRPIRVWQVVQLGGGVLLALISFAHGCASPLADGVPVALYAMYAVLHWREIAHEHT